MELRRAILALALAAVEAAQGREAGAVEAGAGAATVLDGGIHPAVSVFAGMATTPHLMPVAEFTYIPLGSGVVKKGDFELGRLGRVSDSKAWEFHGALHVTVPVGSRRLEPYAAVGAGLVRQSFTALGSRYRTTGFTANFGGGVRWRLGGGFGLRPDLRVYTPGRNFVRLGVSIFYQSP